MRIASKYNPKVIKVMNTPNKNKVNREAAGLTINKLTGKPKIEIGE